MILFYIIGLAVIGGIDQLGNTDSWQFIVLVVLAFLNLTDND